MRRSACGQRAREHQKFVLRYKKSVNFQGKTEGIHHICVRTVWVCDIMSHFGRNLKNHSVECVRAFGRLYEGNKGTCVLHTCVYVRGGVWLEW